MGLAGLLLCFSLFGATVGIPFIIMSLKGPKKGGCYGDCPHCETPVVLSVVDAGANCPACAGRIAVKDNYFVGY
ncbi:protein of unknown function (plasmid) [Caballeronia sp. S22]